MNWRHAPFFALLVSALGAVACTSPGGQASSVPPAYEHVASLHRAKCGACHTRVEPGTRSRTLLQAALGRHRQRVRLTDDDWASMVDYLARPDGKGEQTSRR